MSKRRIFKWSKSSGLQKVIDNVRSFGISLNSIYIPTTGKKSFELAEKEIEFGLGIHGEPGIKRENIKSSKEIVQEMIDIILKDYDYSNSEVALMINGLGGTPEMELFIVANDAHNYLAEKGIKVYTSNVGNFTDFIRNARNINFITKIRFSIKRIINGKKWGKSLKIDLKHANDIVKTIADELAKNEDFISDLDQKIGDGDHGYNIVRGFKVVLEIDSTNLSLDNYFMQIGRTLMVRSVVHQVHYMEWVLWKQQQHLKILNILIFKILKNLLQTLLKIYKFLVRFN
ncbi:dihydroxyacetone kinase subunit DhaK [Mycoplasmopsis cynos]|uniref:dihydroxyacetone kinase subunit DhaK n=1 Tax=Mycoplasmopsis cynos TaxID=171284 RepID=UPI002FEF2756